MLVSVYLYNNYLCAGLLSRCLVYTLSSVFCMKLPLLSSRLLVAALQNGHGSDSRNHIWPSYTICLDKQTLQCRRFTLHEFWEQAGTGEREREGIVPFGSCRSTHVVNHVKLLRMPSSRNLILTEDGGSAMHMFPL